MTAGAIAPFIVDDLVRGVAFSILAAQDESVDRIKVLADMEIAVEDLVLWLNHQINRTLGKV